jgi:hypothetical protein
MIINIPFAGFYNSKYSSELDAVQERFVEYEVEKNPGLNPDIPNEALWHCADYGKAYDHIARAYVDQFNQHLIDEYELDLDLKFESMQSPREYNFETDRIFCGISEENVRKLREAVSDPALRQAIRERFTSRSGFIPSYPNHLNAWNPNPLLWDHNELGTLLVALLDDTEDWDWKIWEGMQDRNVFDVAFDQCVDWVRYDALKRDIISEFVTVPFSVANRDSDVIFIGETP